MIVVGVAVAVVAVLALRQPNGHGASGSASRTVTTTPGSPRPSTRASTPSRQSSSPARGSSSASSVSRSSAPPAGNPKAVPLVVLNDSTITGLASDTAAVFRDGGWTVSDFGNVPSGISDIISTCAYYDPSVTGAEAAAKALQKQFDGIDRVRPRFDDLPAGPIVVVLTGEVSSG